jgi:hypothetical protein
MFQFKFNLVCGTIGKVLNKGVRTGTQIKFDKIMALDINMQLWDMAIDRKARQKIETLEIKFLRNAAGCMLKGQVQWLETK